MQASQSSPLQPGGTNAHSVMYSPKPNSRVVWTSVRRDTPSCKGSTFSPPPIDFSLSLSFLLPGPVPLPRRAQAGWRQPAQGSPTPCLQSTQHRAAERREGEFIQLLFTNPEKEHGISTVFLCRSIRLPLAEFAIEDRRKSGCICPVSSCVPNFLMHHAYSRK